MGMCEVGFNDADGDLCDICSDESRNHKVITVVKYPSDIPRLERNTGYKGVYHVLHGVFSPHDGIGPQQLRLDKLVLRLSSMPQSRLFLDLGGTMYEGATIVVLMRALEAAKLRLLPMGIEHSYIVTSK